MIKLTVKAECMDEGVNEIREMEMALTDQQSDEVFRFARSVICDAKPVVAERVNQASVPNMDSLTIGIPDRGTYTNIDDFQLLIGSEVKNLYGSRFFLSKNKDQVLLIDVNNDAAITSKRWGGAMHCVIIYNGMYQVISLVESYKTKRVYKYALRGLAFPEFNIYRNDVALREICSSYNGVLDSTRRSVFLNINGNKIPIRVITHTGPKISMNLDICEEYIIVFNNLYSKIKTSDIRPYCKGNNDVPKSQIVQLIETDPEVKYVQINSQG